MKNLKSPNRKLIRVSLPPKFVPKIDLKHIQNYDYSCGNVTIPQIPIAHAPQREEFIQYIELET